MSDLLSMRDAFWSRVYELARQDRNVVIVAADMGAPALDRFKTDLIAQFIDAGIAEQQAVTVAAGLAFGRKKVFAYAIAPFITLRCFEQIRIDLSAMNLPVTLVGVGAGLSYEESGPTHHSVEDISVLRTLPNMDVHSISDPVMAAAFADISYDLKHPNYIRLDRQKLPAIHEPGTDFSAGLSVLRTTGDICIVATGNMVHTALEAADRLKEKSLEVRVIDLYTLPIRTPLFLDAIRGVKRIITLEEHTLPGGLGSAVCEVLADNGLSIPVRRMGLDFSKGYCYRYGGRTALQKLYEIDVDSVIHEVTKAV